MLRALRFKALFKDLLATLWRRVVFEVRLGLRIRFEALLGLKSVGCFKALGFKAFGLKMFPSPTEA